MRSGFVLSVLLHGALVLVALVAMMSPKKPLEPPEESNLVDVEMVSLAERTNIAPAPEVKPTPAPPTPPTPPTPPPPVPDSEAMPPLPPPPNRPEPAPDKVAALPPKTEPRPQTRERPKPEPEPEPKKPEPKKPEPEAKKPEPPKPEPPKPEPPKPEAKKAEPKKPETKQPAKPKKDEFNLEDAMAAADKLAQTAPKKEPAAKPAEPPAGPARAQVGEGTKLTASEKDLLRGAISKCWNMPAGAPNPQDLVVRLKLFLNQDGTVARPPELIDTAGRAASDPYFRAAAESAMRAVQVCAPYALPPEKYDDWSEITINFRPPF